MPELRQIEMPDAAARASQAAQGLSERANSTAEEVPDLPSEKMVLNMGPSHPATHGVLRIVLVLEGEVITKAKPDIGYLNRVTEKIAENISFTQFIPYHDSLTNLF